jgi:hypothetical protein
MRPGTARAFKGISLLVLKLPMRFMLNSWALEPARHLNEKAISTLFVRHQDRQIPELPELAGDTGEGLQDSR